MSIVILLISIALLVSGYIFYGRYVERRLKVDPARPTPSHTMHDGVDYQPTRPIVLFGHQFVSITGVIAVAGPIIALAFGWLPALLWVIIGGIFIGAVQDFSTLILSVRHQGRSVGEELGVSLSYPLRQVFIFFLWLMIVLVVGAFVVIVSKVLVASPEAGTCALFYTLLAVLLGMTVNRWRAPLWLATVVGVMLFAVSSVAGWYYPLELDALTWQIILFVYVFASSVAPIWFTLQPRNYLSSFLLFAMIVAGVLGVFVARPAINLPALTEWNIPELGSLFPVLFITVTFGAVSGFHTIVSAGTTAKQLDNEKDARPVAYGAAMVECLLAILAIVVAAGFREGDYTLMLRGVGSLGIFVEGAGRAVSSLGLSYDKATGFVALAVSALAFAFLESAARLGRILFQEFFIPRRGEGISFLSHNRYVAALITTVAGALIALWGGSDRFWPAFGFANQLVTALVLLVVTVWLARNKMKSRFVFIPMIIMFVMSVISLATFVYHGLIAKNWPVFVVGVLLFLLSVVMLGAAVPKLRSISFWRSDTE